MAQDAASDLSLAVQYYKNGEYEQAIKKFHDAIQLARSSGNVQQDALAGWRHEIS